MDIFLTKINSLSKSVEFLFWVNGHCQASAENNNNGRVSTFLLLDHIINTDDGTSHCICSHVK